MIALFVYNIPHDWKCYKNHWIRCGPLGIDLYMASTRQLFNGRAPISFCPAQSKSSTSGKAEKRVTLTVEDLVAALRDRGIHVARPPYYT